MKWTLLGLSMIGSSVLLGIFYVPASFSGDKTYQMVQTEDASTTASVNSNVEVTAESQLGEELDIRAKWNAIEKIFPDYVAKQEGVALEIGNQLLAELISMQKSMDANGFASEIMGIEAMWESFGDDSQVKNFVQRSFSSHVLDVSDVEALIESYLLVFDKELAEIDNQFLVDCQLDVDFDPSTVARTQVDLTGLHNQFQEVGKRLHNTVEEAFYTNLAVFLIENGAGEVGSQVGYELGKDEYGNPTFASEVYSFLLGVTADVVVGEITNQAIGTEADIAQQAKNVGSDIILSQLYFEGSPHPLWLQSMRQAMQNHRVQSMVALQQVLGNYPGAENSDEQQEGDVNRD